MRPSSTTGHSTRPATSSSKPVIGLEPDARLRRRARRAVGDRVAALAGIEHDMRGAQLVAIIGELAHGERRRARGSGGRSVDRRRQAVARHRPVARSNGSTSPSKQADDAAQRPHPAEAAAAGKRIDFGQGKRRSSAGAAASAISSAGRAGLDGHGEIEHVPRRCRASRSRASAAPAACEEAPIACSGAPTRGPRRSSLASGCATGSPSRPPARGGAA